MTDWISHEAAARGLSVPGGRIGAFVADGYLTGSRDQVSRESARGLHELLLGLEAGLLGLEGLDTPPAWVTPCMASIWLDTSLKQLAAMAREGRLRTATWFELEADQVIEAILAVEAAAPEAEWSDAAALAVNTLEWLVRRMGYPLLEHNLREAERLAGTGFLYCSASLRSVARKRCRFNPPRLEVPDRIPTIEDSPFGARSRAGLQGRHYRPAFRPLGAGTWGAPNGDGLQIGRHRRAWPGPQ